MPFLRNQWYCAAWSGDVSRSPFMRIILNEQVVLFRRESGEGIVALGNICPHRFAPLDVGVLHGDTIACRYHGLRFGEDGRCVLNPHGGPTAALAVRSYPTFERDGIVWIWTGDPDRAALELPPTYSAHTDPNWRTVRSYIHLKGNYQLLCDNLLDLTHTQYLHKSLTYDDLKQRTYNLEQVGNTLTLFMDTSEAKASNFIKLMWPEAPERFDHHVQLCWRPVSNVQLSINPTPVGEPSDTFWLRSAHLITPETETTTHYFWSFARNFRLDDEQFSRALLESQDAVLRSDDSWMIELIQRNMGPTGDLMSLKPRTIKSDRFAMRARALTDSLLKKEREAAGLERPVAHIE